MFSESTQSLYRNVFDSFLFFENISEKLRNTRELVSFQDKNADLSIC